MFFLYRLLIANFVIEFKFCWTKVIFCKLNSNTSKRIYYQIKQTTYSETIDKYHDYIDESTKNTSARLQCPQEKQTEQHVQY